MFGGIGAKVQNLDERVRQSMAERAMAARQQQLEAVRSDLAGRVAARNPDLAGVGAAIADQLGGAPEDYLKTLKGRGKAADSARESLYQQAAAAQDPNLLVRLNDMLAGTDAMSRAGQVATYGAVGGGAAAGLTAAGQGLMALMGYLQQGMEAEGERQQPLA